MSIEAMSASTNQVLPHVTPQQAAINLLNGHQNMPKFAKAEDGAPPTVITYNFRTASTGSAEGWPDGIAQGDAVSLSYRQQYAVEEALRLWSDVANVRFVKVDGTADINFGTYYNNVVDNQGNMPPNETYALSNGSKNIWLNNAYDYIDEPVAGKAGFFTISHEIGHALGLGHPGSYNHGSVNPQPSYYEDSQQYTIMSYLDPTVTGGADPAVARPYSPMLHDIEAIRMAYGLNPNTFIGNTVYGFGSNTGRSTMSAGSSTDKLIFSVHDASGNHDIFNFSGFYSDQFIDLREGRFSDVGGLSKNVSIAFGTVIEDVRGGYKNDTIIGNSASNTFYASPGVDHIQGDTNDKVDMRWMGSDFTISTAYDGTGLVQISAGGGPVPGDNFTILDGVEDIITGSSGGTFTLGDLSGLDGHRIRIVGIGSLDGVDVSGAYITPSAMARSAGSIQPAVVYDLGLSKLSFSNGFSVTMVSVESVVVGDLETTYIGSSAIDSLVTGSGRSIVYGGDGNDSILGTATTASVPNILNGDGGNDSIAAQSASFINGGDGHDGLHGSAMADRISGGSGTNAIFAGAGDDTILGFAGNDNIDGGGGVDTFVFSAAIDKVRFHFPGDTLQIEDGTSFATLRDVERVIYTNSLGLMGSQFSFDVTDVITVLSATPGHSMTAPELQAALYQLGQIRSYHDSVAGTQTFVGTAGNDVVEVDESFTSIDGGAGHDTLTANSDNHVVTWDMTGRTMSFEGVSILDVSTFENIVMNARKSVIIGTSGADGIQSGPGGSTVYGNGGDDVIHGAAHTPGNSASFLYGDAGNDTITMAGNDWAFGGDGDDTLISSLDGGHLSGDAGEDVMSGGRGNDSILGGEGDDLIYGSAGADTIDGGAGRDVLSFLHAQEGVHLGFGFVSSDMTTMYTTSPQTQFTGIEEVRGSLHDDVIDIGSGSPNDLRGLGGNDTFRLYYPMNPTLVSLQGGDGVDKLDMSTSMGYYSNPVGGRVYVDFVPPSIVDGQVPSGLVTSGIERIVGSMGGDIFLLKSLPTNITIDGNGDPGWSLDTVDFSLADSGIVGSFSNITKIATYRGSSFADTFDVRGAQNVYGGTGADTFVSRAGQTRYYGGVDTYTADTDIDTIDLTELTGRVTLTSAGGGWYFPTMLLASTAAGGDYFLGMDRIVAGDGGIDVGYIRDLFSGHIQGGAGDDRFVAAAGITFDGAGGHDVIDFGAASDQLEFHGRQMVRGGADLGLVTNYEEIVGGTRNDVFYGGDGMIFRGGAGQNEFHTGQGGSTFYGYNHAYGGSRDVMICDAPSTVYIAVPDGTGAYPRIRDAIGNMVSSVAEIRGSSGDDSFILDGNGAGEIPYQIKGGEGVDTLTLLNNSYFDAGSSLLFTPGSSYTRAIITGFERFVANSGFVAGTSGSDDMIGSGSASMHGAGGNDEMWANGASNASGGDGNDVIHGDGTGGIFGDAGDDWLYASADTAYVYGGQGDDHIFAQGSSAYINDEHGINQIYASAESNIHFNLQGVVSMKDVGSGVFEVATQAGVSYLHGATQVHLDYYDNSQTFALYSGMNYYDGVFH